MRLEDAVIHKLCLYCFKPVDIQVINGAMGKCGYCGEDNFLSPAMWSRVKAECEDAR